MGTGTTGGWVGTGPRVGCSSLAYIGPACGWASKEGPPPPPGRLASSRLGPVAAACEASKRLVHQVAASGGQAGDTCGSEQRRDRLGDSPGCPACLTLPPLARELHGDQKRPGRCHTRVWGCLHRRPRRTRTRTRRTTSWRSRRRRATRPASPPTCGPRMVRRGWRLWEGSAQDTASRLWPHIQGLRPGAPRSWLCRAV